MTESVDFTEQLTSLFESQPLAVLATSKGQSPYTSLVAFAATGDCSRLIIATTRTTRKYANISGNPNISLLIDNRSNHVNDFRDAIAVTVVGTAAEVTETEKETLLPVYLNRHPHLQDFVLAPSCALLVIQVEIYYLVSSFQNVNQLRMIP
jgi:nitroimidazol reductase NimA-like FMN-containing flavoprotein (pyridoxamine 5'-phosphate oxidase superfamily)